jgi:hypothetical protein
MEYSYFGYVVCVTRIYDAKIVLKRALLKEKFEIFVIVLLVFQGIALYRFGKGAARRVIRIFGS